MMDTQVKLLKIAHDQLQLALEAPTQNEKDALVQKALGMIYAVLTNLAPRGERRTDLMPS